MKVGFCTMEKMENRTPNSVGSSRIRARWMYKYWPEAEEYHIGRPYDALVFQKVYYQQYPELFPGIKIFDICDPDWLEPRPVVEMASSCDAVVCSTEAIGNYLVKLIKHIPVVVIPDRVDLAEHTMWKQSHKGKAQTAVWFGYHQNQEYLMQALEFLMELGLRLKVISDQPFSAPHGYEKLQIDNVMYRYETVHEEITKGDIVVLPKPNNLKGRYKSNNKKLTAWALGMPVVDENPDDLVRYMDERERTKEGLAKRQLVEEQYDIKRSVDEYKALLSVLARKLGG